MPITVTSLHRYPIKGLSPEPLDKVTLTAGRGLPHDRRFAMARASTRIDPSKPEWLAKSNFFMLMRDEKLAQLRTRFDEGSGIFTIDRNGRQLLKARITDTEGRASFDAFFTEFLAGLPDGPPRLVEAQGHTFSDARQKPNSSTYHYVSLINLASLRELEKVAKAPVDPLRFRANVYFDGLPAWDELAWPDSMLDIGTARLKIVAPTTRCAATTVNPATAERDLDIPRMLQEAFGHNILGVYAEVVDGGIIATHDSLSPSTQVRSRP